MSIEGKSYWVKKQEEKAARRKRRGPAEGVI